MAWSSLTAKQMVSFTDAQTSGFALKSGQSHVNSNQCMTKNDIITKYVVNETNLASYATNQLVPKEAWSFKFQITQAGLSAVEACGYSSFLATFYSNVAVLVVGSTWYSDPGLKDVVTGGSGSNPTWHQVQSSGNSYKVGPTGLIEAITSCSTAYGGTIRLNIPGVGNDIASAAPGSSVISGYTLNGTITIKNIHATQTLLFKTASLSNPYPILATSGACRLMQYTSTSPSYFNTVPGNDSTIPPGSSAGWLSFGKSSGGGLVVLSIEYQNSSGGRSQEFWTFNI